MSRSPSLPGYSTREVARLLELPERQIRSFVQAGFLSPRRGRRGEFLFSFQDLVVLRAAKGLVAAEIPVERVRRALGRLARQLPRGRPLNSLRIAAEGSQIVVRHGSEAWEPESGQRVLDFEVSELAAQAVPLARRTAEEAESRAAELDADDWYALGVELEAAAADGEAAAAYRRALELDGDHPDAHLNLGRLRHEAGDAEAAEKHYRRALARRPGDATAAFNLGVALQDLDRPRQAVEAYRRAVAIDPGYADAYFNLAGLYRELGKQAVAIRSLKRYKRLTEE
jgi:tetratricopeptide (TPR) repeat protein